MRKTILASAAICMFAAFAPQAAQAGSPSFNCAYAKLPSEVAICKSDLLGDLDSRMAGIYFGLVNDYRVPHRAKARIKREQGGWLRSRNHCGYEFGCLQSKYQRRISRLSFWAQQFYGE